MRSACDASFSARIASGSKLGSTRVLALDGVLSVRENTTFSAERQIEAKSLATADESSSVPAASQ